MARNKALEKDSKEFKLSHMVVDTRPKTAENASESALKSAFDNDALINELDNTYITTPLVSDNYVSYKEFIKEFERKPFVKWVKLKSDAVIPTKTRFNAGFDIYTTESSYVLYPHETHMFPTGIASIIENGYYLQLFERGSTGSKGIGQRCGVIDTSYTGEWFVPLTNTTNRPIIFSKGNRIDEVQEIAELEMWWKHNAVSLVDKIIYFFNKEKCKNDFETYYKSLAYYPTNSKAISQAVLLPCYDVDSSEGTQGELAKRKQELAEMGDTRGDGKLGSSGK